MPYGAALTAWKKHATMTDAGGLPRMPRCGRTV